MRILLLIDALDIGGAETHVLTLGKGLSRQGHEVSVVSSGGCLERALTECGVAVYRFPTPVRGADFGRSLVRHVALLRRLHAQHGFDILHAHTRRTALLLRLFGMIERLCPSRKSSRRLPYRRRALRRLAAPALVVTAHAKFEPRHRHLSFWGDMTVAVSDDLREHLFRAFGVPRERVRVVPNGIDGEEFCLALPDARRADVLSVTFASRLDRDCSAAAKALIAAAPALATEAKKRGKRLQITVIGGGDNYQEIARLAARANEQSDGREMPVQAVGATECVADYFRQTDIFVGVSRAALEAAACGCLVVLAGDEGFGGCLTDQNFDEYAKENFCCRGKLSLRGEELQAALTEHVVRAMDMSDGRRERLTRTLSERVRQEYGAAGTCEQICLIYKEILEKKRCLKVLIGGYAGCGNLGDDAILRCLVKRWHHRVAPVSLSRPDAPPVAPGATLSLAALTGGRTSFDIPCVSRRQWSGVVRALWQTDAFALGGGALLQNCSPHGARSLAYYLALLCLARLMGCPFSLIANGIGPLNGELAKRATITILRRANEISVRDERSLAWLGHAKIPPERCSLMPDPVLSIEPDADAADRLLMRLTPCPFVCIIPRPSDEGRLSALAHVAQKLWQECGVYPLFFAFDRTHDASVCQRLIEACGAGTLIETEQERAVAGVFGRSVGVVSMRLHGLILARAAGACAVCVPYATLDQKTVDFAVSAGQDVAQDEDKLWKIVREWVKNR